MVGIDFKSSFKGPGLGVSLERDTGSLTFNFLSAQLPAGAIFTRASDAIAVQSNGNLVTRNTDVARFEYSPVTGALLGLRLEPGCTNLVIHAGASALNWIADSCTASNLSLNALGMFPGVSVVSTGQVWGRLKQNISLIAGQDYQVTCLMRAGSSPNARISISGTGGESQVAGVIGAMANTRTELGTCTDISDELLLDGLSRRLRFSFSSTVTGTYSIGLGPQTATLGQTIELLGFQVEQASSHSSFIDSGASVGQRAADQLFLPMADGTYDISLEYGDAPSEEFVGMAVVSGYQVVATGHALSQVTAIKI